MTIHTRFTPCLAVAGLLALGGASTARAQETTNAPQKDTSAAAQSDTSGYGGYSRTDTAQAGQGSARTDSTGFKYTGPPTDTALKAKPGAQTGTAPGDSGQAAMKTEAAAQADTVVCKDGSNAPKRKHACAEHGGLDRAATKAAMKARGAAAPSGASTGADTGQVQKTGAAGYQYNGPPSDTVLKAKPGAQTGADSGGAGTSDTSAVTHQNP